MKEAFPLTRARADALRRSNGKPSPTEALSYGLKTKDVFAITMSNLSEIKTQEAYDKRIRLALWPDEREIMHASRMRPLRNDAEKKTCRRSAADGNCMQLNFSKNGYLTSVRLCRLLSCTNLIFAKRDSAI